jgi:hypothetical protein
MAKAAIFSLDGPLKGTIHHCPRIAARTRLAGDVAGMEN